MSRKALKIAIVIPVHNRRETTLQGLKSLTRASTAGSEVTIFVVDDGSTDGTSEAIRSEFPEVVLIRGDGNLHYAAGTNRGVEKALEDSPDYIVTMNDDSIVHEDFLLRMIRTAESNPRTIVGALLLLWDEPHRVFQVGQTWRTLKGGWEIPQDLTAFSVPESAFPVECIVGNCVLFPAEAFIENGFLDEKRFPHGWGDAQFVMRLRKAGWNLLVEPKALVWCEPNTYPAPLHRLPVRTALHNLIRNQRSPQNLWRQFIALWESAPTKIQAVLAFTVYLFGIFAKSIHYAARQRS